MYDVYIVLLARCLGHISCNQRVTYYSAATRSLYTYNVNMYNIYMQQPHPNRLQPAYAQPASDPAFQPPGSRMRSSNLTARSSSCYNHGSCRGSSRLRLVSAFSAAAPFRQQNLDLRFGSGGASAFLLDAGPSPTLKGSCRAPVVAQIPSVGTDGSTDRA